MRGYKVKITLNGSKPSIWRTCILPEGLALRELPDVLERIMGWRDSEHEPARLARFTFPDAGETFESDGTDEEGQPVRWLAEPVESRLPGITTQVIKPRELKPDEPLAGPLLAAAAAGSKEFTYTFLPNSAAWEHRVQVQKVVENGPAYPELLAHSGDCPPAEYEGGIFRYQSLSPKEKKKTREGHFHYRPDMIQERLKSYYTLEFQGKEKPPEIRKIKINEDDMAKVFLDWVKKRNENAPEHYSYRDALENVTDEDIDGLLNRWDIPPEEYESLNPSQRRDLVAQKYEEPGMLERYLRCINDQEWTSIKHAVEWDTWRYYLLPGEDDFRRLWWEASLFRTECQEIETPDLVREIFPSLDEDKFFQRRRQQISWIRDCVEMAVQLYGFVPISQVVKLCKLKPGTPVNEAQVLGALEELTPVQRVHVLDKSRHEIRLREIPQSLVDALRPEVHEELEYMMPHVDTIGLHHGTFLFPDDKKSMDRVEKHLERWAIPGAPPGTMERQIAMLKERIPEKDSIEALEQSIRQNTPQLLEGKSPSDVEDFLKKLLHLGRHIRCWVLKGWTQDEVDKGIAKRRT